jgi:cytochrome c-type biogenesis protein CcmE
VFSQERAMNRKRSLRIFWIFISISFLGLSLYFILQALKSNINLYLTPSELRKNGKIKWGQSIRLGGLVLPGSIQHKGLQYKFLLADKRRSIAVQYQGILPALFKPGKGAIVEGKWQNANNVGTVIADRVLAKHDEYYQPPKIKYELINR